MGVMGIVIATIEVYTRLLWMSKWTSQGNAAPANLRVGGGTALHLLEKLRPDAGRKQALDANLALLKTLLQAVGHQR
jgi:hypothetical protein